MKKFLYLLVIFLFLSSCSHSPTEKLSVFSGIEMTISYRILIGKPLSLADKKLISAILRQTFDEVNQVYNKWNPESELSQLNKLKSGVRVQLSPELEKLLILTDEIVHLTDGRFDPTIEPLQALWKSYLEQGKIPSLSEIQSISSVVGWNKIHFNKGQFYKEHDATHLDLGGIAKGYCVDLLVNRLNQAGFDDVFVEWGGEIRATGQHPDQRPWNIFISRMGSINPQEAIAVLSLKNQAIATSGDYLQNWTVKNEENSKEETTYFHVLNPYAMRPLVMTTQSIASASVVAFSCALADGLATAAMTYSSVNEAEAWGMELKKQLPELSFWILSRD